MSTPTFEGEASETEPVTVRVHEGAGTSGPVVASLTASVSSEHKWHVTATKLPDGTYTAVAIEPSSIGNEAGEGSWPTFEIDTAAPVLGCAAPQPKSGNTTPAFSGTSNESGPVFVNIVDIETSEAVETLKTQPSGSGTSFTWTTAHVAQNCLKGRYKEVATQNSSLGNAQASCSHEFEVSQCSDGVPECRSNLRRRTTKPTFSGTASEKAPVKVVVYEGLTPKGKSRRRLKPKSVAAAAR